MKNFLNKMIATISAMLITITCFPTSVYAANTADDVIEIAINEIGYKQSSNGYTKYGDYTGYPYSAWCQSFVAWCCKEASVPSSVVKRYASCTLEVNWFKNNSTWYDSEYNGGNYIPKKGDLIFFRWYNHSKIDHVGFVEYVENGIVHTIEGNTSYKVARESYNLSSNYIVGYGVPDYDEGSSIAPAYIENSTYVIKPTYCDKVIETAGGSILNETYNEGWAYNVALWDDYRYYDTNQTWDFEYLYTDSDDHNVYRIKNHLVGQYLVMDDSNLNDEAPNVSVHENGDSLFAFWKVLKNGDSFNLINISTGKALDVYSCSSENSANVCGYKYDPNDLAEKFYIEGIDI